MKWENKTTFRWPVVWVVNYCTWTIFVEVACFLRHCIISCGLECGPCWLILEGYLTSELLVQFLRECWMSVCLSSVTLLCHTQSIESIELFGNIYAPGNSLGTWVDCINILGKNSRGSRWLCKLCGKRVWKIGIFRLYLEKNTSYGHSYRGRWIGTRIWSVIWCHANDLEWPLTQISRPQYYSTLNNSKMIQDREL